MPNKIKKLMIEGGSRLKKQTKKTETLKAMKTGGKGSGLQLNSTVRNLNDSRKITAYKDIPDSETSFAADVVEKSIETVETDNFSEGKDDFIARNISPQMKESLKFVMRSNISLECLEVIEQVSIENKNLVPFLKKLDKYGLTKICEITDDDDYVITTKLRIIALLNKISKNEIIHKLLRRTGALIQALRRLKELLFVNL
ncbi:hypothetical protein [Candidatus Magnetomonas plexicatena]|uniref:hypothetical protein n=1 Tax=Candidatus Magnetomonas plexicatena TaxID=2552947 RepID=UPI001C756AC5|nr:hypothetical protein E2O03_000425 [Nitrospirales bacterium LBB_01]